MKKNKILKIALSLVLCVSLLTGMAMVANAASDSASGTLNGTSCSASLTMGSSSANACTYSGYTAAGHTVSVTYSYSYYDGTTQKYKSVTNSGSGTASACATAYGSGQNISSIEASSTHKVTYNGQSWSTSLYCK